MSTTLLSSGEMRFKGGPSLIRHGISPVKRIHRPSGDQRGLYASVIGNVSGAPVRVLVNCLKSLPFGEIMNNTPHCVKAILSPFGDHAGAQMSMRFRSV